MFDNYYKYDRNCCNCPTTQVVTEKRAPTDDSVRLYAEFKDRAYQSIIDCIKVDNNILNFKAIYYKEFDTWRHVCEYRVKLNGEEFIGIFTVDPPLCKSNMVEEVIKFVANKIAIKLTEQLIPSIVEASL